MTKVEAENLTPYVQIQSRYSAVGGKYIFNLTWVDLGFVDTPLIATKMNHVKFEMDFSRDFAHEKSHKEGDEGATRSPVWLQNWFIKHDDTEIIENDLRVQKGMLEARWSVTSAE